MKGKIYKNKLSSPSTNDHLHTDISSIYHPIHEKNISSQIPYTPGSLLLSPQNHMPSKNNQSNVVFRRTSQNKTKNQANNKLFPQSITLNKQTTDNLINKFKQNQQYEANSRLLKRVLSNPNLTSYQLLMPSQNREDQENQNSILNRSSNSSSMFHVVNNNSKITQKDGNYNQFGNDQKNMNINRNTPLSHLNNRQFQSTHPLYKFEGIGSTSMNPHLDNANFNHPHLNGSNLAYQNNDSLRNIRNGMTSQQITTYQKRHKQRLSTLQSQHQIQIQFFQEQLKSKDELIEEMKKMLKQKQQLIKRLQSENTNLSSRSYISFAN